MNNSLKFRVWDVKNNRFLPESHFAILGSGKLIVTDSGYFEHFTNTNPKDYVIQQYTGVKDYHAKEIYVGDILQDFRSGRIGNVLRDEECGCYIFEWKSTGLNKNHEKLDCDVGFECAIVGHVYVGIA